MGNALLDNLRSAAVVKVLFTEIDVLHDFEETSELASVDFGSWRVAAQHQLQVLLDEVVQSLLKLQGQRVVADLQFTVGHQQSVDVFEASDDAVDGRTVLRFTN